MSILAESFRARPADGASASPRLDEDVIARRMIHRRETVQLQLCSYICTALIICLYAYTGVIPVLLPLIYALTGAVISGVFLGLSQIGFNDRFEDHYLTLWQMTANILYQVAFLIAAPQIGYVFFCAIILTFSFATLRLTGRQAMLAWTVMTFAVAPLFLVADLQIGMPGTTRIERFAALLVFAVTIAQCALIGLYGSGLRHQLYQRKQALKLAYKRIEELAEIDELTGAFNRRSIMRTLDKEIARARRMKHPCCVALIDLDWFKRINDAFGHPAGDEVLRTFAITVFANIRGVDTFGRYGGEEFLLVLPETHHDDAERLLNRLRIIISGLDWSALSPATSLSISAGIATLMPNETSDTLLARADAALYIAKRNGRNRIASAA